MKLGLLVRRLLARARDWIAGRLPGWKGEPEEFPDPTPETVGGAEGGVPEHWRRLTRRGPPEHWLALLREHGVGEDSEWDDIKVGRTPTPRAKAGLEVSRAKAAARPPDPVSLSLGAARPAHSPGPLRFGAVRKPDQAEETLKDRPPRDKVEPSLPPRFSPVTRSDRSAPPPKASAPPRASQPPPTEAPVFQPSEPIKKRPPETEPKRVETPAPPWEDQPRTQPTALRSEVIPVKPRASSSRQRDWRFPAPTWPFFRRETAEARQPKIPVRPPLAWAEHLPASEDPGPSPPASTGRTPQSSGLRFAALEPPRRTPQPGSPPDPRPDWPSLLEPSPEDREAVVDEFWRARSRLERLKKEQRG